nr:aspartate aminotransferase family protein [Mycolicibacterium peregrinum]
MSENRPTMVNSYDPATAPELSPRSRALLERRQRVLGPGYRLFYANPVEVVRGERAHLFDADGNDYLDAYNNVPSVGHCHPVVTEALSRQAATVNTNTRYLTEGVVAYAEDLLSTFESTFEHVTFTSTGSEANDLAYRIARHETGREGIIVTRNAYHGLTARVAEFSPSLGVGSPLGPHVRLVDAPDESLVDGDLGAHFAAEVRAAIDDLTRHGYGLAAMYADTIFSSDGIFADPPGFLAAAVAAVHAAGGLFIADEVQPGFTRLGSSWWGYQRHGIEPDMVTLGKPMGNGMPIAAVVQREAIGEKFGRDMRYFNTFGGNSVSIAAAHAVLTTIRDERLLESVRVVGEVLKEGITSLTRDNPRVISVRGAGLFIGVEVCKQGLGGRSLPDAELASRYVNELRERRVLISASGPEGNVLKVRPPLCFDTADADRFLTAFESVEHLLRD